MVDDFWIINRNSGRLIHRGIFLQVEFQRHQGSGILTLVFRAGHLGNQIQLGHRIVALGPAFPVALHNRRKRGDLFYNFRVKR